MQQLEKFPSDDYIILEPIFQNDSFLNCRAFNKFVGTFAILKYVSLSKTDPQTQTFFSYLESLNQCGSDLFVRNLNIFYDDSSNQQNPDPNLLTLVLLMENNVATLRQVLDERNVQNQPYEQEELVDFIYQWASGFMNISSPDLRAMGSFQPEAFFLVPNIPVPSLENDYVELNTTYSFRINNFDSFLGPTIDPAEENIVISISAFIFQIIGADPEHIPPEIFAKYPNLCNLLLEMRGNHLNLEKLLAKLENMEHRPPNETAFWPVNPVLPDLSEIERVKNFDALVEIYNNLGFYSLAFKPAFLNYQFYKENNPKGAEYAKALNDVGVLFWRLGKYEDAKTQLLECANLMKEIYGQNHISTAICYNNLGLAYEDLNDMNEALRYLELSYEIKLGLGNVDKLAMVMNNLANLNDKTGLDEEKAKTYYENALEIKQDMAEVPDQSAIAITLNNLAVFYANRGDLDKAMEFIEKEKKISENLSNESYIISLNNLAYISARKNLIFEAQNLYASAMIILAKQFKMRTLLSANVMENYAALMYQCSDYKKVASILEKVLEIKVEVLGPNNMSFACSATNFGEVCLKLERYDDAIRYLQRGLEIKQAILGPFDKKFLVTINNIGYAYLKVKNLEQAGIYFEKGLTIDSNDVTTLNNNGLCFCLSDNLNAAAENYFKAWNNLINTKGENNEEAMKIANNFAAVFVKLKDYEKADEYLRNSLRIAETVFPEKVEFAMKTKERLEHLDRVKEKNEKAFL